MVDFVLAIVPFITWEIALWVSRVGIPIASCLCRLAHATNTATRLLLMCWDGGWEWARLSVALDVWELDSYLYSLLIYTPGGGSTRERNPSLLRCNKHQQTIANMWKSHV